MYSLLLAVIGAPQVCYGYATGISFRRLPWFGGCATHVTPCSVPGYSYLQCVQKNRNTTVLQVTGTMQQFSRVFLLRRCCRLNLSNRNKKNNDNQQKTPLETIKPPTVFTTALTAAAEVVTAKKRKPPTAEKSPPYVISAQKIPPSVIPPTKDRHV